MKLGEPWLRPNERHFVKGYKTYPRNTHKSTSRCQTGTWPRSGVTIVTTRSAALKPP